MWIHDHCFYQFDICRVLYTRRDENDFSIAMVSWGIPCVWSVWREMKQQTTTISSTGDADDDTHVCTYIGSCPQSWAGTSSRRPRHRISREYGKNSRPFILFVLCRRPPTMPWCYKPTCWLSLPRLAFFRLGRLCQCGQRCPLTNQWD